MKRIFFLALICLFLTSCKSVDFKQKGIAAENKVIGLSVTVPGTDQVSLSKIEMGYIDTRYLSVPKGCKGTIKNKYNDISLFLGKGNAESEMSLDATHEVDSGTYK